MNQRIFPKACLFGIGHSLILISSQPILAATFEARSQISIPTTFGGILVDRQEVRTSLLEETITVFSSTDDAEGRAVISLDPKLSSTSRTQKTTFGNAISGSGISSATIGYEILGIPGVSLPNEYITLNFPIMGNFEGIANGNEDEVAFFSIFSGVSFNLSVNEKSAFGFANVVGSTPDSVFLNLDSNVFGNIFQKRKNSSISFDNILSLEVPLSSLSGIVNSSVTAGSLSQGPGSTSRSEISLSPIPQSVTADDVLLDLLKRTSENGEVFLRFETGEEIRIVSNQQKRFDEEQKNTLSEGALVNGTFALLTSALLTRVTPVLRELSLTLAAISFGFQELSKDPPDPNFDEISVPLDLVSKYQPINDEFVGLQFKEAFDLININLLETLSIQQALLATLDKADGAFVAQDDFWLNKQEKIADSYSNRLGQLIEMQGPLYEGLAAAYEESPLSEVLFNKQDLITVQEDLALSGFSAEDLFFIESLGFDIFDEQSLRQVLLGVEIDSLLSGANDQVVSMATFVSSNHFKQTNAMLAIALEKGITPSFESGVEPIPTPALLPGIIGLAAAAIRKRRGA